MFWILWSRGRVAGRIELAGDVAKRRGLEGREVAEDSIYYLLFYAVGHGFILFVSVRRK